MTPLPEEIRADFMATYDRLKATYFGPGIVTDEQELAFVEELIRQAEAGDVAHNGAIHHITPAEINYLDEATLAATQPRPGLSRPQLAILGALGAAFIGYILLTLLSGLLPSPVSATPTAPPTILAAASPPAVAMTATAVPPTAVAGFPATVNGERLPAVRPNTLELGGRSFLAYAAPVKDGNWMVSADPGLANWVPGATINWAFALYVDSDSTAPTWVAGLTPPLTATVRVADGRAQVFQLTERQLIRRTQTEVLDPHRAGLTIVIRSEPGDTRLLLRGAEVAPNLDRMATPPAEGGEAGIAPP
jgi:hypothetical protein